MENKNFEDSWKNAFEGAESAPDDSVWTHVESDIAVAENQRMRSAIVMYRRLAAAMAAVVVVTGALSFYYWKEATGRRSTPVTAGNKTQAIVGKEDGSGKGKQSVTTSQLQLMRRPQAVSQIHLSAASFSLAAGGLAGTGRNDRTANEGNDAVPMEEAVSLAAHPAADRLKDTTLVASPETAAPAVIAPEAILKAENPEKIIAESSYREKIWVSAGAATGSYNPGGNSHPNYDLILPGPGGGTAINHRSSLGTANSLWITIGRRISKRWILQSGVTYLNQSLGYISNLLSTTYSKPQAYVSIYSNTNSVNSVVTTSNPYAINSVLEFISIPVQVGYLVVDRRIGFQFNGGAAADVFLRNTLRDQTGHSGNFSKGPGSDSPYHSVDWAGLISAELSYRVAPRYRLSIVPGMRYLFTPALKTGSDHPSVMDIGFRFRYILK